MSIIDISKKIFFGAGKLVKKLPGVNKLIGKKNQELENVNRDKHIQLTEDLVNTAQNNELASYGLADELSGILELTKIEDPYINDGIDFFEQITQKHIKQRGKKIELSDKVLSDSCIRFIDSREEIFKQRILSLNQKQTNSKLINYQDYDKIFNDFFQETLILIYNFNNFVFSRLTKTDLETSNIDLMQALKMTKNITANLCSRFINDFELLLNHLPKDEDNKTQEYQNTIKTKYKDTLVRLLKGSRFGIISHNIFSGIEKFYLAKKKLSLNNLQSLKEFHQAVSGAILLSASTENIQETGQINKRFITEGLERLSNSIVEQSLLNKNPNTTNQQNELENSIADMQKFLADIGSQENAMSEKLLELKELVASKQLSLGLSQDDAKAIINDYQSVRNAIRDELGEFPEEKIRSITLEAQSVINTLIGSKRNVEANDFSIYFKRNILETSLKAAYWVLSQYMDKENLSAKLEEDIQPKWLKNFFDREILRFQKIIEQDPSPRKTINLAFAMCDIAKALNQPDIRYFSHSNFISRHKLTKIAESALKRVSGFTDVNYTPIALKVYSELFSNLDTDAQKANLNPTEIKWLHQHIDRLMQLFTIIDPQDGKAKFGLGHENKYELKKFHEIQDLFKKQGYVSQNLDLVIKYFQNAVNNASLRKQTNSKYSDLDSRNILLSTALLYQYIKFIPEEQTNLEELRNVEKIIELFFDEDRKIRSNLPKEQKPKVLDELCGTESDPESKIPISKAKYERNGFLRSYALGLEEKLDFYIAGKTIDAIDLNSLLNFYYRLEENKNRSLERQAQREASSEYREKLSEAERWNSMGTWTRQVEVHNKFYDGKNKELLPPLEDKLVQLLDTNQEAVIKFVNSISNKTVKEKFSVRIAQELFKKASEKAKIINQRIYKGHLEVKDTNVALINNLVDILTKLGYCAQLSNTEMSSQLLVSSNSILGEQDRSAFEENFNQINQLMSSRFLLSKEINSVSQNIKDLKEKCLYLLKQFKIRPTLGNILEWIPEEKLNKQVSYKTSKTETHTLTQAA